MNLNQR